MSAVMSAGTPIDGCAAANYFGSLVSKFYKILPMRENEEDTLTEYMCGLQTELLGFISLAEPMKIRCDPTVLSLASRLRFLIDNADSSVDTVRREVFRSITLCQKLREKYAEEAGR